MIKVSKNICFKIIKFHHTLNIIVICKTHGATEPIYKIYCGVYPLSADFKAFRISISLSEVGTKGKVGIRFYVLLDVFYVLLVVSLDFLRKTSKDAFEITKFLK